MPYDAGLAVLGILASYNSRTSLLQVRPLVRGTLAAADLEFAQDFAYYNSSENTSATQNKTTPTPSSAAPHTPHYAPRPPQQSQPPQQQQYSNQYQPYQHNGPPYPNFRPDMSHSATPPPQMVGPGAGRFFGNGNGAPNHGY